MKSKRCDTRGDLLGMKWKMRIRSTIRSWNEVKGIAGDGNAWKLFMDALCSTRSKRI